MSQSPTRWHSHQDGKAYLPLSSQTAAAAAEAAADRKIAKYAALTRSYSFVSVAAETMGVTNNDGIEFLCELGMRIN